MSGSSSRIVKYHDAWDCYKFDSTEESYKCFWHGTSDVIEFVREGKCIASLSKGDAWLFMNALVYMFYTNGGDVASWQEEYSKDRNPFYNELNPFDKTKAQK